MDESTIPDMDEEIFKPLTVDDKSRLYTLWKFSVIVKVFGKKIGHQLLKNKLTLLWQPTEQIPLIDLGSNFFLMKFQQEENMHKALHGGP